MSDALPPGRVRSSVDEPAAVGGDRVVPAVSAWQRAADEGAAAREAAAREVSAISGTGTGPILGRLTGMASAVLPEALWGELVDWMRAALPNEGCGLLVADGVAGTGGVPIRFVGTRNAAASPYRYLMDPEEQLRVMLDIDDRDEVVWAIVHSHVASPAVPSVTDIGLAAYPDAIYLLVSFASQPPELRAWSIVSGAVDEVALERT